MASYLQIGGAARPSNVNLLVSRWETSGCLLTFGYKASHMESSLTGA